eukprot:8902283-Lingulodinium_polyedra.AAC.1
MQAVVVPRRRGLVVVPHPRQSRRAAASPRQACRPLCPQQYRTATRRRRSGASAPALAITNILSIFVPGRAAGN